MNGKLSITDPILVLDSPSSIGMTVPKASSRKGAVTVRDIANVIGHAYPVSVIDVRHQEELEGWTMGDLVEYFEDEERLNKTTSQTNHSSSPINGRRRRAAAKEARQKQQEQLMPPVLNQISLEFSRTPLCDMVKSPKFVRDLDWIDHAWPRERREKYDFPMVQYYCLTSTAGCFTDFHVDFGGTSVWYHVLRGEKQFALIRPTKENLAIYEDWLCRSNQAALFLPDMIENKEEVLTVSLKASQTLIIPTGWIHAVYTPTDSLVFGGNYLHGLDISLQLEIHYLETRTRVPGRFRFPHFLPLIFYAGGMYMSKLQSNAFLCERELEGLEDLIGALEGWWKLQADETLVVAAKHAAQTNGCESVEEFLTLLNMERARRLLKKDVPLNTEKPKLRLKLASDSSKLRVTLSPPRADTKSATETALIKLSPPREAKPASKESVRIKLPSPSDTKPDPDSSMRLDLSSPGDTTKPASTSLRIKLSPKQEKSASSDFRIVLPPSSRPVLSKRRKSAQREGLDEYIPAAGDDEWEPEVPKKRRTSKPSSSSNRARSKCKPVQAKNKSSSSSRQRLMKRFR